MLDPSGYLHFHIYDGMRQQIHLKSSEGREGQVSSEGRWRKTKQRRTTSFRCKGSSTEELFILPSLSTAPSRLHTASSPVFAAWSYQPLQKHNFPAAHGRELQREQGAEDGHKLHRKPG